MNCCTRHVDSAGRFFGFISRLHARRYSRKGLEDTQRLLVTQLESIGFEGKTLLEIGCGVGVLHQTLIERGAQSAVGIDLAEKMLHYARDRAEARRLTSRVEYQAGDFVALQAQLQPADITLLDKVVCCYPDPETLLDAAARKTRHAIALTYPRKRLLSAAGTGLWNLAFWLLRSDFRVYVHDPGAIVGWLRERGFRVAFARNTLLWHTEVFATATASVDE